MVKLIRKFSIFLCALFTLSSCGGSNQTTGSETSEYRVSFDKVAVSLVVGESYQLKATVEPNNRIIFYEVRDPEIASITSTGIVTGLKVGETVCYASVKNVKAICNLSIKAKPLENSLSISLRNDSFTLRVNDEYLLPLEVLYGKNIITDYSLKTEIETPNIIEITNKKIKGLSIGETNVLLKVNYQEKETAKLIRVKVI